MLKQFLLRTNFVKKNKVLWCISYCFLFPFSFKRTRGFFSDHEDLVELQKGILKKTMGDFNNWFPLDFLVSTIVHTEPPAICQSYFRLGFPHHRFLQWSFSLCFGFLLQSVLILCIHLPVFSLGGSGLFCDFTSFTALRGVVDFSVYTDQWISSFLHSLE